MKHIFSICTFILMFAAMNASAKIDLNGTIRNDAILLVSGSESLFVNLLENRLRFQRKTDAWKFDSDLKVDVMTSGALAGELSLPGGRDLAIVELLRAYVKYYSAIGDFSIGKTYVNFGIPGVFNPFELDQNFNATDLNATKSGLVALAYDFSMNDMTVGKLYVSPQASRGDISAGGSFSTNIGKFDMGMVVNHLGWDDNVAGVFVQGDLELGAQASWAYHWDDEGGSNYSELVAGLDYSFFDGKWVTAVQAYFNSRGVDHPGTNGLLDATSGFGTGSGDSFPGRYYLFADLTFAPDEFTRWDVYTIIHTRDTSGLVIPSWQTIIADGLTLSVQCIIPTGTGDSVYSRDQYGDAIVMLRLEAKL